jgi:hypothetical protein
MEDFYFTFGQTHYSKEGQSLKSFWVKVTAANLDEAIEKFESYNSTLSGTKSRYAMTYTSDEFDDESKYYYPGGEYNHIS